MEAFSRDKLENTCLIFPFSRTNANAISALLASLDIHPILQHLPILLPNLKSDPKLLDDQITKFSSVVLAFSVYSTQVEFVSQKIVEYRQYLSQKNLVVIAGGPHAIGDPVSMLINGADVVCTGEGELVIREIIEKFVMNDEFHNVLGISFLNKKGKIIRNNKSPLINLDDFPPFSNKHQLIRPIEITRGCAWNCRFCQIRSRGVPVRHRSIAQILEYIKLTINYFITRRPDIRFISPNALSYGSVDGKTLQLSEVELLLKSIREIIGKDGKIYFGSFPSEVRPETITEESVKILKKYTNVEKIIVGGQSGSDKVLEQSDRGHSVEETEKAVQLLLKEGFQVDVDIIFGLPGEEEEDVTDSVKHIQTLTEMGATIHSHTFLPLAGTPFGSKPPGTIKDLYLPVISELQSKRKLSGFHVKQEKEAKKMADRRKSERTNRKKKSS